MFERGDVSGLGFGLQLKTGRAEATKVTAMTAEGLKSLALVRYCLLGITCPARSHPTQHPLYLGIEGLLAEIPAVGFRITRIFQRNTSSGHQALALICCVLWLPTLLVKPQSFVKGMLGKVGFALHAFSKVSQVICW